MSKVVISMFVSLDGVAENPMWSLDYWNDDIAAFKLEELRAAEAQLLGRVTYDGFVASWPQRSGDEFTDRINSMPKYVLSTTVTAPEWNSTVIKDVSEIARLKQQGSGDLLVYGGPAMVQTLIKHDLVDRFNLMVYPIVLGTGQKLFDGDAATKLKLVESQAFATGVMKLIYEPAR